jgi:heterodisulfide reductase subunit A-like polyferredoxin
VKQCQFSAIEITQEGARLARIDPLKCMGCGVCVSHCTRGALSLVRDASRGEPLEILHLMDLAE